MAQVYMSRTSFDRINSCANEQGVIAAAAMDQRGSLQKSIAKARGSEATGADLSAFKEAVTRVLTPYATAILLDPEYGLGAIQQRAPGTGVLLSYEETGYDVNAKGRLPDLLPEWSVLRLREVGADVIKVLLYYNFEDDSYINTVKQAFIERVGAECAALEMPFFLEPLYYADGISEAELARRKPSGVIGYMEEFSKPRYGIDMLKVEVPVNMKYVEGSRAFAGDAAYTQADAQRLFREAAAATQKPFIYLSAGVSNEVFLETLELAGDAGADFAGVLCGRATWQNGIPVYATEGYDALIEWLEGEGVENIKAINRVLAGTAKPWWQKYGGRENIILT